MAPSNRVVYAISKDRIYSGEMDVILEVFDCQPEDTHETYEDARDKAVRDINFSASLKLKTVEDPANVIGISREERPFR